MNANAVKEESLKAIPGDEVDSTVANLRTEVTNALQYMQALKAERDQLRERVTELEAECKRLAADRSSLLHSWADLAFDENELDRISKQPGGRTWAEIKADLEKL